ncbi:MAG: MFS transporter [Candidatus Nanopelagicales bacterium]
MNPARRLVVLSALRWVPAGLVIPVLVLMLGARGLSLAQTGQMMALYSVVTLSLELPTGGLADAWGRRPVIVASAVLQALSLLHPGRFGIRAVHHAGHGPDGNLAGTLLGAG